MLSMAVEAYEIASKEKSLQPVAEERIDFIEQEIAIEHMDICWATFNAGKPGKALRELAKFPFLARQRKFQPEIDRLSKLCQGEIARRNQLKTVQAEALLQQAERRFYTGEREEAMLGFEALLSNYGGTPAAQRAARFRRLARVRMDLENLIGDMSFGADLNLPQRSTREIEREIDELLTDLGRTSKNSR